VAQVIFYFQQGPDQLSNPPIFLSCFDIPS